MHHLAIYRLSYNAHIKPRMVSNLYRKPTPKVNYFLQHDNFRQGSKHVVE